jgi:hypothetical protein
MILQTHVPFEERAGFMLNSMCPFPDSPEFAVALQEHAGSDAAAGLMAGLNAYHELQKRIYTEVGIIEGEDNGARHQDLLAMMAFLYAFSAFGALTCDGDGCRLSIDKATLKREYKRGSFATRQQHLGHHGFSFAYLTPDGDPASLNKASQLALAYQHDPNLLSALKLFAGGAASFPEGPAAPMYNRFSIFLKADLEAAIVHRPMPREALNPLRCDLVDTVAAYRQQWLDLVDHLHSRCGLGVSGFWSYGGAAAPAWSVSFAKGRKRPLAIFTLGPDIVFIEFTLPLGAAEQIILARQDYSTVIREQIESFRCVNCSKECRGKKLTKIDGVWLCNGRAEARRIYTKLNTPDDFASIHAMLDIIEGGR